MKLSYPFLISILAASVSSKTHRLCCCAGFDQCGLYVCDGFATQTVVNNSNKRFIRSEKSWDKNTGSPCGGLKNWLYAAGGSVDDDWVGGDEMSGLCDKLNRGSRCFSPSIDHRNASGPKMVRRQQLPVVEKLGHPAVKSRPKAKGAGGGPPKGKGPPKGPPKGKPAPKKPKEDEPNGPPGGFPLGPKGETYVPGPDHWATCV